MGKRGRGEEGKEGGKKGEEVGLKGKDASETEAGETSVENNG